MSAFPDSYVISEVSPAWRVVAAVQALVSTPLSNGILSRGAIVHGKVRHTRRVLFGPAVIEAYDLEQNVAKHPRILVSERVRTDSWSYHQGLWKQQLFRQDVDGCWFLNVLTPCLSSWKPLSNHESAESARRYLRKLKPIVESQIDDAAAFKASKWRWL